MAENENVLQRSMFNAAPSTSDVNPTIGIPSVRSPAQTANELRNMFAPAQPVQSFQGGGLATKIGASALDIVTLPYQLGVGFFGGKPTSLTPFYDEYVRRAAGQTGEAPPSPVQRGGAFLGDVLSSPVSAARDIASRLDPIEVSPPSSYTPRLDVLRQAEAARGQRSSGPAAPAPVAASSMAEFIGGPTPGAPGLVSPSPSAPEQPAAERPAPERQKGALELTLDGIKAERARSAEDKKQNALLALMQAGFAIAAGRSPSAIANIGAGAQAGIASFANMEKERRADDAALRREQTAILLERERMRAQEERQPEAIRSYAALGGWDPSTGREGFNEAVRRGIEVTKTLEKDPEQVRFLKALGGGDLMRGFEIFNKDKNISAAQTVLKDTFASEDEKKTARAYLNNMMSRAMSSGGGGYPGFSATPVR